MENILELAKIALEKDGKLAPMAFMRYGGDFEVMPLSFRDNDEKNRQLSLLRRIAMKKNADIVFILTESWYVTSDIDHIDTGHLDIEPSKDPARKECILMVGECEDESITIMQIFDREDGKENGKIIFGEKIDMREMTSSIFNFGIKDRKKSKGLRDLN